MGSYARSGLPAKAGEAPKSVLVSLDALFPRGESPDGVEGLELRGWAPGALHRWVRSTDGEWVGVCTVLIGHSDGSTYKAVDQLVPAQTLRPKKK